MNVFKKIYARTFQAVARRILPLCPYHAPKCEDAIEKIPALLRSERKQKPLIVTGKTVVTLPFMEALFAALQEEEISYAVFSNVPADPTVDTVEAGLNVYLENGCDSMIAVGGGSPMDCAKIIGARVARPEKTVGKLKGLLKIRKAIPLLIAVPTTAGTGSETSVAAVVTDADGHKYAVSDFCLVPSYAVLDAETTSSLPPRITAFTGMDALTHAVEAYIGNSTTKATRADALEAIKLIFENLAEAFGTGSEGSRKNMLTASYLAGRAFTKSYVGYVHALAHPIGGKYHVPHGLACAVLLSPVLKGYGKKISKKLCRIARYCGWAGADDRVEAGAARFFEKLDELKKRLQIPETLDGIKEEDLDGFVRYAEEEAYPLYPVPVLKGAAELKEIYRKIME